MSDDYPSIAEPVETDGEAAVPAAAWRTEQAARRLNIPYRTLMNLIHDGRLAAVQAGRYYLVPEAAIQKFLRGAESTDSALRVLPFPAS